MLNNSNGSNSNKRVVFTTGGKGGVGKTGVSLAIGDWYNARQIPFLPLDLDTENKALGSLRHYFPEAQKVDIHTDAGLDIFLSILAEGQADIILADMGGGAGQVTYKWFQFMKDDFAQLGISFTAVGVITPDPASVESVLTWASNLEDRVHYLIVENSNTSNPDFTYWQQSKQARAFRDTLNPTIIPMEFRLPELERIARQYGVTLRAIGSKSASVANQLQIAHVIRAQRYTQRFAAHLDRAEALLVPSPVSQNP
jgi:MinD-like ATPase involved in chromosome partitioning or flagellar assembly